MNESQKEHKRLYRLANREKLNAQQREWRVANPEKKRVAERAWRIANPEKVRAYRAANREKANVASRERYAADPEKARARQRAWCAANPEKVKSKHRTHKYNMTPEEFDALTAAQQNKCAICGKEFGIPHVDHDHATGKVRALLCKPCNSMLGMAKDSQAVLQAAIDYLKKFA
jgi:ribosomal protein L32